MKLGDLSKTEAWRPSDQLPPGSYLAKVVEAADETSKSGNPMIVLDLQVCAGEWSGAEIRDWVTVIESTLGKVVQVLQAFGITIPEGDWELKVSDLVGKVAEIVVRPDSYTDGGGELKETTKVKGYRMAPTGSDVPSDTSGFTNGVKPSDSRPVPF